MNLLDSIKTEINSTVIDKISNYLNIARGNTSNAITAMIPTVLGYFSERSKTDAGSQEILNAATDSELSSMFHGNSFQDLFEKNRDSLMAKGNSQLVHLFGGKEAKLSEEIAGYSNISKEASDGILASITPLILNVLGNKISNDGLNASSFSSTFDRERDSIFSAIPAGLASLGGVLGLNHLNNDTTTVKTEPVVETTQRVDNTTKTTTYTKEEVHHDNNNGGGMMKWLLPLLGVLAALALLWYLMKGCDDDKTVTETEEVASAGVAEYVLNAENAVVDAAGNALMGADGNAMVIDDVNYKLDADNFVVDAAGNKVFDMDGKEIKIVDDIASQPVDVMGEYDSINNRFIYDVGNDIDIALPDGTNFTVGENSTEAKLFNFLSDENAMVSENKSEGWIVLDRVYFETGSNNLDKSSLEQLDRVAKIMNAYPNAHAKLGGYTDNQGGQEINQPLSQARAEAVMNDLAKAGVAADRLEAEGYGQEHFVCPANDTPECMAQNRRVDIRVTSK